MAVMATENPQSLPLEKKLSEARTGEGEMDADEASKPAVNG